MTATLTDPTPLDPGVGGRVFTWPELERAGVVLEAEQIPLLFPPTADKLYVMCIVALPDPFAEARLRMLYPPKLRVFDNAVADDGGVPWVVPMFGQVDCSAYAIDLCEGNYGPHWGRFPSQPVQLYDRRHPHEYRLWPDMVRVWNAWPVDVYDQQEIEEVSNDVMRWWSQLYELAAVHFNDIDVCELVHGMGQHEHVEHPLYGIDAWQCVTGESYVTRLRRKLLWNDDVHRVALPGTLHGYPWVSDRLGSSWRRLFESSFRNTLASLDVVPPWMHEELARIEQEQTPWL